MFFQQHQQQQSKLIEIIRRIKTASLYVDAYGRPVQTAIGSTDVIPLAQAAHALGVGLPQDLKRIAGRVNQYPIAPVMRMAAEVEKTLMATMGIPPIQVAGPAGPQFQNNNPGSPVFGGHQNPNNPQFPQPQQQPSPYTENPFFSAQPQAIQPVQPDLTNVLSSLANQVSSLQQNMAAMQMAVTNMLSVRPSPQPQQPVQEDSIDDEILAHLNAAQASPGRVPTTQTVAEQLGLLAPGSGIPSLGDADDQQLASVVNREEDDDAPVKPSRTPESLQGKNKAPSVDDAEGAVEDVDPLTLLRVQTDGAIETLAKQPSSSSMSFMSFKQLEVEMKSRGLPLESGRTKQSMIKEVSAHDITLASQLVG